MRQVILLAASFLVMYTLGYKTPGAGEYVCLPSNTSDRSLRSTVRVQASEWQYNTVLYLANTGERRAEEGRAETNTGGSMVYCGSE